MNSISKSASCLAQQAVDTIKKISCPMIPLPQEYDEWKPLPSHNEYMFYTSHIEEAYLQCVGKERFNISMGIVKIPPGCMIQTRTKVIYGSTDRTASVKRHYAMVTTDELNVTNDKVKTDSLVLTDLVDIQDKTNVVMQEAAQNLAELDASNVWMWVAIGLGNVLVIAVAIIIISYYCKTRMNDNANDKLEQTTIEMTSSQVNPIPLPTPRSWDQ